MAKLVKIAIDAGHGINTAGKRTPDDEREWSFNNKVANEVIAELAKFKNVKVLRLDDPTGKRDVPLRERTDAANAWGADVLVSIHHNALKGVWGDHGGVETYTQPGSSKASEEIAVILNANIVKAMGLRDRGVKKANLHMTRESRMPAVLTEGGFMDSRTDIGALRDNSKLRKQGEAIAEGLARYFGLTKGSGNNAPTKPAKPSKPPVKPSKPASIAVDGYWGPATTRRLQSVLGTVQDGVISGQYNTHITRAVPSASTTSRVGSNVIRALQRKLGIKADGWLGPDTVRALQKRYGTPQDGKISKPSLMVKSLQRKLNSGTV